VLANAIGILSKMGHIDAASAMAMELLPLIQRTRRHFVEEWVYLFWRRGQNDLATLLLGASDARNVQAGEPPQPNERRLIAAARAALEAQSPAGMYASRLAAGAALSDGEIVALISEGMARPRENTPRAAG